METKNNIIEKLNKFIDKEFNFDWTNDYGYKIRERCTIIRFDWDNFKDGELQFTYKNEHGLEIEEIHTIETWDMIKKTDYGYKIYFDDTIIKLDEDCNIIGKMDAFFE